MILKTLTLQGFKSFANRTVIELPGGVAAIVGPNGSGKSNISDAIRWVMGEQSIRTLRGTRLEDVIFSGSDTKRAVGMAEVSLTFDNTSGVIPVNYSEVTITRRVFRSGESEFFVNRRPCRLRDIQELFIDTGMGRGSLAMIGQGEVDLVLSAKPEERRAFLDEAAGIAKYRVRKREALVKLDETRDSLEQVSHIIVEVEARMAPLKEQAATARQASALKKRLDHLERQLLHQEYAAGMAAMKEAEHRLRQAEEAFLEAERLLTEAENETDDVNDQRKQLDELGDQLRSRREEATKKELSALHRAEMVEERIRRADEEAKEHHRRIQRYDATLKELDAERDTVAERMENIRQHWERAKSHLAALEQQVLQAEQNREIDNRSVHQWRDELLETSEKLSAGTIRIEGMQGRIQQQHEALLLENDRQDRLAKQFEEVTARWKKEKERGKAMAAALEQASRHMEPLKNETAQHEKQLALHDQKLAAQNMTLQELKARRAALAAVTEGREGYHRGVREVLRAAERFGWRLHGAVAELIRVDARLETAMEVALGGSAQFVVVETDEDAKNAIAYLKKRQLGRVTFLPLDFLRAQTLHPEIKRAIGAFPGVIGVASDLVEAPSEVMRAIVYLLGRVVITKHIDGALALSKQVRGFQRAVSLDGDVVVPGGAMTGGSRPNRGEGLLARNRLLPELDLRIEDCQKAMAALQKEKKSLEEALESSRLAMSRLEEERSRLQLDYTQWQRDVDELERAVERIETERRQSREESEELQARLGTSRTQLAELIATQEQLEKHRDRCIEALNELERMQQTERGAQEQRRHDIEKARIALVRIEEEAAHWEREIQRLERERQRAEEDKSNAEEKYAAALAQKAGAEQEYGQQQEKAAAAASEAKAVQASFDALQKEKERLDEHLLRCREQLKQLRSAHQQAAEERNKHRVAMERAHVRMEQVRSRFLERNMPWPSETDTGGMTEASPSIDALRKACQSLRRKLEALGPVNMHSLEEYEEVKARHEFLTGQKQDLQEAIQRLEEVIARIDRESSAQLAQVFEAVRRSFQKTFTRLFGGGRADLSFTDPDHLLESGIDIYVQPPGKKRQNLLALSGGEKALAAVALLFALLDVRPIPFCVLDEVDAALDEHNLERFRALLLEYAANTQFLIITHRQVTMEGTERLFGVTMEEPGVSTLVALDLDEARRSAS